MKKVEKSCTIWQHKIRSVCVCVLCRFRTVHWYQSMLISADAFMNKTNPRLR
jgi:hypothetical protein